MLNINEEKERIAKMAMTLAQLDDESMAVATASIQALYGLQIFKESRKNKSNDEKIAI